jgi:signal peptidase II
MRSCAKLLLAGAVIASCVGCDQATKTIAFDQLVERGPISLLGGVVRLTCELNPGAFLGLGSALPASVQYWVLAFGVSFAAACLLGLLLANRRAPLAQTIALSLVVGGGVGNVIDRFRLGAVRDFVILAAGPLHTGVFNVADASIAAGAIVLVCAMWRQRGRGGPAAAGQGRSA